MKRQKDNYEASGAVWGIMGIGTLVILIMAIILSLTSCKSEPTETRIDIIDRERVDVVERLRWKIPFVTVTMYADYSTVKPWWGFETTRSTYKR